MASGKRNTITTFAVLLLLTVSILYVFWTDYIHSLPRFYTVGKIERVYSTRSSGKSLRYSYRINGVQYDQTANLEYKLEVDREEGLCFIISVPRKYLNKGRILQDYPTNGYCELGEIWEEIPARFKMMKVEEY